MEQQEKRKKVKKKEKVKKIIIGIIASVVVLYSVGLIVLRIITAPRDLISVETFI